MKAIKVVWPEKYKCAAALYRDWETAHIKTNVSNWRHAFSTNPNKFAHSRIEASERNLSEQKRQRYPILDLVRFGAALLVATYHWGLEVGGGYSPIYRIPVLGHLVRAGNIGVPIFFVISGYVILETAWRKDAFDFLIARFIRLFPGLLICMTLVLVIGPIFVRPYATPLKSYLNSIFLTFTLTHTEPLATQLWTLVVEVQFYGAIFFLLLILKRGFRSVPLLVFLLTAWQLLLIYIPNRFTHHLTLGSPDFLFGLGISINLLLKSHKKSYMLMTSLLAFYFLIRALDNYKSNITVYFFFLGTVIAIALSSFIKFAGLPAKVCELLGLSSYLIYLLHEQLGMALLNELRKHFTRNIYILVVSDIACLTILSIFISLFFEKRLQNWTKTWLVSLRKNTPKVRDRFTPNCFRFRSS